MARVLVTNDDGIDSPGLHLLAQSVHAAGHEVLVAAPATDASGTSASINVPEYGGQVDIVERALPGPAGVTGYALAAPPALITLIAIRGGLGPPPQLVLSGINRGANTGHAVLHSGTVGAALTGAANGCASMALSVEVGLRRGGRTRWEAAARLVPVLLPVLSDAVTPLVLNVNAPDLPVEQVRGLREARLAAFGSVQTNVEAGDGYVQLALVDTRAQHEPGTDVALLASGYATVTAITPIFEVADVSLHHVVDAAG
jgi:5'-nucleotidase